MRYSLINCAALNKYERYLREKFAFLCLFLESLVDEKVSRTFRKEGKNDKGNCTRNDEQSQQDRPKIISP